MPFAIKYQVSEKCKSEPDRGRWVWVVSSEHGATASPDGLGSDDLFTLPTRDMATRFIEVFGGHPWYFEKGNAFEVVEVAPRMVSAQSGWSLVP